MLGFIGRLLANYLEKPSSTYFPSNTISSEMLESCLQPADVLLVEGNQRISVAIKYLTQSTWSHTAIYIGDALGTSDISGEPESLVEADLKEGIRAIPVSAYARYNTRICRPVNLTDEDREKVIRYVTDRIGYSYDLKNVVDLARYLFPTPPVPARWRRRMISFGSGDPTRAICSTLIAQAFQEVRYPILPDIKKKHFVSEHTGSYTEREIMHIRHHSLFTPKDFDISPYFEIIKPTLVCGFEYKKLIWEDDID